MLDDFWSPEPDPREATRVKKRKDYIGRGGVYKVDQNTTEKKPEKRKGKERRSAGRLFIREGEGGKDCGKSRE